MLQSACGNENFNHDIHRKIIANTPTQLNPTHLIKNNYLTSDIVKLEQGVGFV